MLYQKITELLKVLDMSEDEQWKFITNQPLGIISGLMAFDWNEPENRRVILADLAFRLRDENLYKHSESLQMVHEYVDYGGNRMYSSTPAGALSWFCFSAKPIHWIITALVAKEVRKEAAEKQI